MLTFILLAGLNVLVQDHSERIITFRIPDYCINKDTRAAVLEVVLLRNLDKSVSACFFCLKEGATQVCLGCESVAYCNEDCRLRDLYTNETKMVFSRQEEGLFLRGPHSEECYKDRIRQENRSDIPSLAFLLDASS